MDPINGLNDIVRLLRQRLVSKGERAASSKNADSRSATDSTSQPSLDELDISELRRRISDRISALDPDKRSSKHATRIFLESIMIWEFGQDVVTDPEFDALISKVHEAMLSDHEIAQKLDQMLTTL